MENKEEQFTKVPHWLMKMKKMTDQDKLTLSIILSYISNSKDCFIGNEGLSKMLGISKNAASLRIKKLEERGYIKLNYTYQEGKKEVDRRYITLLPITTEEQVSSNRREVSSNRREVSSIRREGVVSQTMGYLPPDDGVSSNDGGIRQGLSYNGLDNPLYNPLHNLLDNKIDKGTTELITEGIEKQKTPDRVFVLDEESDMFSTKYNDLAENEFQRLLNKKL